MSQNIFLNEKLICFEITSTIIIFFKNMNRLSTVHIPKHPTPKLVFFFLFSTLLKFCDRLQAIFFVKRGQIILSDSNRIPTLISGRSGNGNYEPACVATL